MPKTSELRQSLRIQPGRRVRLERIDAAATHGWDKASAEPEIARQLERLVALQDRFWAESKRSVLVVLQGIDASGKDGTIKHVMTAFNPQGSPVTSFKVPSAEELAHDYLWRIHKAVPRKGEIGDLQPFALRGRPGRPRPRHRAATRLVAALRADQRVRAAADRRAARPSSSSS